MFWVLVGRESGMCAGWFCSDALHLMFEYGYKVRQHYHSAVS